MDPAGVELMHGNPDADPLLSAAAAKVPLRCAKSTTPPYGAVGNPRMAAAHHSSLIHRQRSTHVEPVVDRRVRVAVRRGHILEYACHENNYALAGILRGARFVEREPL